MKNILIALVLAVAVALGAIAYRQASQAAQNRAELRAAHTELTAAQTQLNANAEATDKAASAQRSAKALQETLEKTSAFADEKAKQAEQLQSKLAEAKTNSSNPMAGFAKMFKDPKMRDMIKASQKTVMGPMIEKQYGALFKQLNMTADESGQLKKLLTDKMLSGADAGMSLMDNSLTAEERAVATKQIKTQSDDYDAQIKTFLGDGYPAFADYEKSVPDRMAVSQFTDQLSGDNVLSADQNDKLIQAMGDARKNFKWTTDFNNQNQTPPDGDFSKMFAAGKLDTFATENERFDTEFLAKAGTILSPTQLKEFEQHQKTQRDLKLMGLKMAEGMFGNQTPAPAH